MVLVGWLVGCLIYLVDWLVGCLIYLVWFDGWLMVG
jgi:hypothetical protein